jgi:hypothetical protein
MAATSSSPWCQIFESVQTPPAALAKFSGKSKTQPAAGAKCSSQSNTTVANFRVSPRPLRTAPTKTDWRAINSYLAISSCKQAVRAHTCTGGVPKRLWAVNWRSISLLIKDTWPESSSYILRLYGLYGLINRNVSTKIF